mmetsp:Transcript_851/g.1408  ORF Transcript_851/g.1408 Transcript_851/m.1408 type:complete len:146 (+) Transcript_851:407-844(+)
MDSIKRTVLDSMRSLQVFDQQSFPRLPELSIPSSSLFGRQTTNTSDLQLSSDLALDTSVDALNFFDILDEPKTMRTLPRISSLDDALCIVHNENCNFPKQSSNLTDDVATPRNVGDDVGFEIASFRYSKTGEEPKATRSIPKASA